MLSMSDTYSSIFFGWDQRKIDRSVLWACSKDPCLIGVTPGDQLFVKIFDNSRSVSGGGSQIKFVDYVDRYDTFQGLPPLILGLKILQFQGLHFQPNHFSFQLSNHLWSIHWRKFTILETQSFKISWSPVFHIFCWKEALILHLGNGLCYWIVISIKKFKWSKLGALMIL